MNLSSILNKTQDTSKLLGSANGALGSLASIALLFNPNYWKQMTGSGLTDAQKEANEWSAQQAEIGFQREAAFQQSMLEQQMAYNTEMSNTAYQRQVKDMQAAGLNPMLALGAGGAASPSVSSGSASSASPQSVSPGALGNLAQLLTLQDSLDNMRSQTELNKANANKANADANKIVEDTRGSKLSNDYFERMQSVREESERLVNDLTKSQIRELYKRLDVYAAQISKDIESMHESQERQVLIAKQALLAETQASDVVLMRPYVQNELVARAGSESAAAKLAAVDMAYKQRMLDTNFIEKMIEVYNSSISESGSRITANEAKAELDRISGLIAKGDKHALAAELGTLDTIDFWTSQVFSELKSIVDAIPVNFVIK